MEKKSKINSKNSRNKIICFLKLNMMIFIILGGLLSVSTNAYLQNFKISISMKNVEILEVIKEIEKQSDFDFFYKNNDFKTDVKINIDVT
ncbi:MAG: hypothetical protein KAW86_08020, partial [Bacteroidales bacterium]|nr:hypothetical protein [Bacteroidales bacterium]